MYVSIWQTQFHMRLVIFLHVVMFLVCSQLCVCNCNLFIIFLLKTRISTGGQEPRSWENGSISNVSFLLRVSVTIFFFWFCLLWLPVSILNKFVFLTAKTFDNIASYFLKRRLAGEYFNSRVEIFYYSNRFFRIVTKKRPNTFQLFFYDKINTKQIERSFGRFLYDVLR